LKYPRILLITLGLSISIHLILLLADFIPKAPGIKHDPAIMSISMKYQQVGNSTEKLDSDIVSNAAITPKAPPPKKKQSKTKQKKTEQAKTEKIELEKKVIVTQSSSLNSTATQLKKSTPKPAPITKPTDAKKASQEAIKAPEPIKVPESIQKTEPKPTPAPPKIASKPRYKLGSSENPKPSYPSLARKKGWGGVVIIGVHVDKDGGIVDMTFAKSTDFVLLNYEAWETVLNKWTFEPLSNEDGSAVEYIEIPFHFGNK